MQAPVVTTRSGKGALSDHHHLSLGYAERGYQPLKEWMDSSDVLLAVGTSTDVSARRAGQTVIQIDIDGKGLPQPDSGRLPLVGDARVSLEALFRAVTAKTDRRRGREAETKAFKERRFDPSLELQPQGAFTRAIRDAIPDD